MGGDSHLRKDLQAGHVPMFSIGGVIGPGLFMGSGAVIHAAQEKQLDSKFVKKR
ncbi:hypothetical protein [Lihuaxuella thermophila]|uniref:D-serine/D-alanine/glycine transporter n=1 Tax=Lihuaxuella thermophila TaxID=1173111 RepID=A0A1H8EPI6_9BACL|nr:hypothetical protein [Lihuaxuella thermophila]SEN21024.1 D-serine/D-alanine/glycine transporter [Lihuaxuella thermophila]